MDTIGIEALEDVIQKEPLTDGIDRLMREVKYRLETEDRPEMLEVLKHTFGGSKAYFWVIYIAGPRRYYDTTIEYMKKQLSISAGGVYSVNVNPSKTSINCELESIEEEFKRNPNKVLIVQTFGFQDMKRFENWESAGKTAHFFNQMLTAETDFYKGWTAQKKIVVAVYIDPAGEKEKYERAIHSACSGDFHSGVYKIEVKRT